MVIGSWFVTTPLEVADPFGEPLKTEISTAGRFCWTALRLSVVVVLELRRSYKEPEINMTDMERARIIGFLITYYCTKQNIFNIIGIVGYNGLMRRFLRFKYILVFLFIPLPLLALDLSRYVSLPFGGKVVATTICTCPESAGNLYITMSPFFSGAGVSGTSPTGSVVYVPATSKLYAWFSIGIIGTWHLGSYKPGVQSCLMLAPPPATGCVPLPAAGTIERVGTSRPATR